jgi:CubicO group peptidase (beta-lactamase class C family)
MTPTLRLIGLQLVLMSLFACTPAFADGPGHLPRTQPEAEGVSSPALLEFVNALDEVDAIHSVMVVRHGQVVAEGWWTPYAPETPHILYSLSKSFTSTAVGLAVADGLLSVDDPVVKFFPDEAPDDPSENLQAMKMHDLLRMNTGHETEPPMIWEGPDSPVAHLTWVERFFAHPVAHAPGSRFVYNTPATYMQSAIVQKVTGETVLDYLRPRLFEPLGVEDPQWITSPEGISTGGYGFMARTEEIAKFGQLYLQHGEWSGEQLLSADWVREATSIQSTNGDSPTSDWAQGYGYQFWRSRHNAFRGDGAFGQYCLVLPEQQAVVAITSGVADMQNVLNIVWDKLLPAFHDGSLPDDTPAQRALLNRLSGLTMRMPAGESTSTIASDVSGRSYEFAENDRGIDAVALEFADDGATLVVRAAGEESHTPVGLGTWITSQGGFSNDIESMLSVPNDLLLAASGAWTADDVFTIKLVACETPFYSTLNFHFDGDRLELDSRHNVAFGPTQLPQLLGEMVAE